MTFIDYAINLFFIFINLLDNERKNIIQLTKVAYRIHPNRLRWFI